MTADIRPAVVGTVVVDCPDPGALAAFWSALLGRPVASAEPGWVALASGAGEPALAFQRVEAYHAPRWRARRLPQQLHLDLRVPDLEAAVTAAVALGARVLGDVQDRGGAPWQVLEDPAGHPFCLVTG